jgi:hypothetical protein
MEGNTNIIWLPPDYRDICCSATRNRNIILGHSGKILFFYFEKGAKLVI